MNGQERINKNSLLQFSMNSLGKVLLTRIMVVDSHVPDKRNMWGA